MVEVIKEKVRTEVTEIEGHPYIVTHYVHPLYGERISLKRIKTPEEIRKERERLVKGASEIAKKLGVATFKVVSWIGREAEEGLEHLSRYLEEKKKKKLKEEVTGKEKVK